MSKLGKIGMSKIAIIIIMVGFICVFFYQKNWKKENKVIVHDIHQYYQYLPAFFIDKELRFEYENDFGIPVVYIKTEDGVSVPKMTMGLAYLYAPFFALGHVTALITEAETNGFTSPYKFFLSLSSLFYFFIGLFILRKLLILHFSEGITAFTIILVSVGTNLNFYVLIEGPMSHSYNFMLLTLFVYMSVKWHEKPTIKNSLFIGLISGLISLIRPTNTLISLFFILYNVTTIGGLKNNIRLFVKKYYLIIIILVVASLVWLPQLLLWKRLTGDYFYFSYGYERFYFDRPNIINGLFSYRSGWFVYTPLMFFAVLGTVLFVVKKILKAYMLPLILFLCISVYILLSWWSWWFGGSLGLRAFIDFYGILSIPLAALIAWTLKRKLVMKIFLIAIISISSVYGMFQTVKYYHGTIHWDAMTKEAFWHSFFHLRPKHAYFELLLPPDYHKASQGIEEYGVIYDYKTDGCILFDTEHINTERNQLCSNDSLFFSDGVDRLTTGKSYSGTHSLVVNNQSPYAFNLYLPVNPGENYIISVKKFGFIDCGSLEVSASDPNNFHLITTNEHRSPIDRWREMHLEFSIPENYPDKELKIYTTNFCEYPIYYDDLIILKK